nr:unnamed protein product [Callosobruchus analis]
MLACLYELKEEVKLFLDHQNKKELLPNVRRPKTPT